MSRCPAACALLLLAAIAAASECGAAEPVRVEARSKNFLAVGLLKADRMSVHLSRIIDNAPVHDAAVTVALRSVSIPAAAEPDGSYSVRSPEFEDPGPAIIAFIVTRDGASEKLVGTLEAPAAGGAAAGSGTARQLWWWVLNFGVCIGFLVLFSRRRKARADHADG